MISEFNPFNHGDVGVLMLAEFMKSFKSWVAWIGIQYPIQGGVVYP